MDISKPLSRIMFLLFLCLPSAAGLLHAEGLTLENGLYGNIHQLILVSDSLPSSKVYKTFNTYWYDGPHDFDTQAVASTPVAQIGDGLYLDYCIRYGTVPSAGSMSGVWLPGGNSRNLSVNGGQNDPAKKERLTGYYISDSDQIWAITWWRVDAEFDETETATLTVTGSEGQEETITIQKKVSAGGLVYTCTVGRSTRIRHPEKLDSRMLEKARMSSDGKVLSFGEPLFTRLSTAPSDLDALIESKNSTVYPPRFLWITPQEPSIYAIIEQMPPHIE